jgi:hypothetical protein
VRLKREMNAVSAQDEFARWAKLRRTHDKAVADYEKSSMSRLYYAFAPPSDTNDSKLGSRHQGQVRQDGQHPSLARYKRHALSATVLVLASSTVLAPTRLGSWLRRMAPRISQGTQGQHQHPALGYRMCQRHFHGERGYRRRICVGHQAPRHADSKAAGGATSIQERRSSKHSWSGQEGVVDRGIAHDYRSDTQRGLYLWLVSQHFDARSSKQSSETATRVR